MDNIKDWTGLKYGECVAVNIMNIKSRSDMHCTHIDIYITIVVAIIY